MNATTLALTALVIVLWGIIPIFDKAALAQAPGASPLIGIAIRAAVVAVVAVPLALSHGGGVAGVRALPPLAVMCYVASGLTSLLLSQWAYYVLLKQADVSRVFPFLFSAAPIVTIALGVLVFKEALSLKQALGALLVIGGGVLLL